MKKVYALTMVETHKALAAYLLAEKGIDLSKAVSMHVVAMLHNGTLIGWEELEEEEKK